MIVTLKVPEDFAYWQHVDAMLGTALRSSTVLTLRWIRTLPPDEIGPRYGDRLRPVDRRILRTDQLTIDELPYDATRKMGAHAVAPEPPSGVDLLEIEFTP